jgi:hypothetical protein
MKSDSLDSPIFGLTNTSFLRMSPRCQEEVNLGPLVEKLPGYFINREGDVEPALPLISVELSETEAFERLGRALAETGQLVVRTADGLMTAWFAGIGDPDDLFVELRPREAWVDREELVMGSLCSLADAGRLLRCMYVSRHVQHTTHSRGMRGVRVRGLLVWHAIIADAKKALERGKKSPR